MTSRIVVYAHRYWRPPPKRRKAVALEIPSVVTPEAPANSTSTVVAATSEKQAQK
jgi:hypothetical protein